MRMCRRFGMGDGGLPSVWSYSGEYALFGDETSGRLELYSSGVLSVPAALTADLFAVGGGAGGGTGYVQSVGNDRYLIGGVGGGGGYTAVRLRQTLTRGWFRVIIGAGGAPSSTMFCTAGGTTYFGYDPSSPSSSLLTAAGAVGGMRPSGGCGGGGGCTLFVNEHDYLSGGAGGSDGADGGIGYGRMVGIGQHTTTRAFRDTDEPRYAGGGGGGGARYFTGRAPGSVCYYAPRGGGGAGGGGSGCSCEEESLCGTDALPHTGGGGGGGGVLLYSGEPAVVGERGGAGSAGIVILRW